MRKTPLIDLKSNRENGRGFSLERCLFMKSRENLPYKLSYLAKIGKNVPRHGSICEK